MKRGLIVVAIAAALVAAPVCSFAANSRSSSSSGSGSSSSGGGSATSTVTIYANGSSTTVGSGSSSALTGTTTTQSSTVAGVGSVTVTTGTTAAGVQEAVAAETIAVVATSGASTSVNINVTTSTVSDSTRAAVVAQTITGNGSLNDVQTASFQTAVNNGVSLSGQTRTVAAMVTIDADSQRALLQAVSAGTLVNTIVKTSAAPGSTVTYVYFAGGGAAHVVSGVVNADGFVALAIPAGVTTMAELR